MNRRALAIAYAIGLVPALALAIGQPVWSRVDEAAHYDVIAQYAAGVYPRDAMTTIRPPTLSIMERSGVYGFVVDNAYARPDPEAGPQAVPAGLDDAAHVLWIRRHGYQYSYEAFQPPLYYVLALPVWLAGDAVGGPLGALCAVRVFDALLAALLAPLAFMIAIRIWPARRGAAWAAAVLTAVLPGVALNLSSVTNDGLVSVFGSALALVLVSGHWTRRRVVLAGVLFGAALLTKTTAIALVPALALAMLQRGRGGSWRSVLFALGIAAVMVAPWIAANLAMYGEVIATKEQLAMAAFPQRTLEPDFWTVSTLHSFVTFWSGDPFLSLPGAVPLALLGAFLTALALAGLLRARRSGDVSSQPLAVAAVIAAGAALVSASSPVLAAFEAPGRLAYVGVTAAMALVAIGLWHELRSPVLRRGTAGVFCAISAGGLAVFIVPAAPVDVGLRHPLQAQVRQLGAQSSFDTVEFDLTDCAVDGSGNMWLGVQIQNHGSAPAEWSQNVEVQAGGRILATATYVRSTQFPMALAAGFNGRGWLWLGPRSVLAGAGTATVRFRNVATEGYRRIGDVVIVSPLC